MPLNDLSSTPAAKAAKLASDIEQMWSFIRSYVAAEGQDVYGNTSDDAIAIVSALGTSADAVFGICGAFQGAISATAALVGGQPLNVVPVGYTYTSNGDGSGVLTYTAPPPTPSPTPTPTNAEPTTR